MSSVTWFRFSRAGAADVVGPVQGCGGKISGRDALPRLLAAQRAAIDGSPLTIYEPDMGHVRVSPGYCADGDGDDVFIALADWTITVVDLSPLRPEHKSRGRYRGLLAIEWRGYFGRSGSGIRMTEGEARMLKARQRQLAQ